MSWLRQVIRETHRRALWQVVSLFLVGSWALLRLVGYLTRHAGLPEWAWGLTLVLLLVGFPVVVATAFVQEGWRKPAGPSEPAPSAGAAEEGPPPVGRTATGYQRLFTWRNAILGGLGAGTLLVTSVFAYVAMWATGVGPMGSLIAQGVLNEGDAVILAELDDRTDDSTLAAAMTEALRIDLFESTAVTLMDGGLVQEMLRRMDGEVEVHPTARVAREAAVREGIKAVLEGELSREGEGYVLAARVVAPVDGRSIAAFRESAESPESLLGAVDHLSLRIRQKLGESLRDLRGEAALEAVTTSSLDALRRFAEAKRADREGDVARAVALLREAVALDTTFALAHRNLAVLHAREGDHEAQVDAVTRAYGNRDRLTERERHLTEAHYHRVVTGDHDGVARAYRRILDSHPHDPVAQGHLGLVFLQRSEWTEARELLQRVVDGPGRSPSVFGGLVISLYNEGRKTDALGVVDRWAESYPMDPDGVRHRSTVAAGMGDPAMAETALEEGVAKFGDDPRIHVEMRRRLSDLLHAQGRLREARGHLRDARALAVAEGMHGLALAVSVDLARVRGQETGDTLGEMRRLEQYADGLAEESLARHRVDLALGDAWAHVARRPDRAEDAWSRHQAASRTGVTEGADEEEASVYRRSLLDNLRGRHAEALDGFRDLARRTECDDCYLLEMAEALIGVGEPDSALLRLETWVQRDLFHLVGERERRLGDVLPLLAGLFEQAGRFEDARAAWLRHAARWAEADSSLQPRVRRAVEEAERLAGQRAG